MGEFSMKCRLNSIDVPVLKIKRYHLICFITLLIFHRRNRITYKDYAYFVLRYILMTKNQEAAAVFASFPILI